MNTTEKTGLVKLGFVKNLTPNANGVSYITVLSK